MHALVEVTAPRPVRTALEAAGHLKGVRFVTIPSSGRGVRRLAVARIADLEEQPNHLLAFAGLGWAASMPFVLLAFERWPTSAGALQLLALLTSKLGRSVDPYVATDVRAARRIVAAHGLGAERKLIASASVANGILSVWSCEPRLYQCPVSDLPALAMLSAQGQTRVEVTASGSRLHWSEGDVDLDLDAVRQHADPDVRKEAEGKYRADALAYGHAIRKLRVEHQLRQGQIPGLSDREVRRLEQGEVLPHADTLRKLAEGHGYSVDEYMKNLARLSKHRGRAPLRSPRRRTSA
jgi:hypothetical protein